MSRLYGRFDFSERDGIGAFTFSDPEAGLLFSWPENARYVSIKDVWGGANLRKLAIGDAPWSEEGLRSLVEDWYEGRVVASDAT